jgi:hypothetical protein
MFRNFQKLIIICILSNLFLYYLTIHSKKDDEILTINGKEQSKLLQIIQNNNKTVIEARNLLTSTKKI